ncbi:helix-turn-helix domain-containing protein [Histophilus somni]|uniref:helix-turn-helix domain-containing protein n=1 Tax=Histophilus somni TaxID=731 RepID=UPI003877B554
MSKFYDDLMGALLELEEHLDGKRTLKTEIIERTDPLVIKSEEIKALRNKLNLSQAVFALKLRTSIRTYQNWEQGKTKPNAQAILLLKMVDQDPNLFNQIATL